MIHAYSDLYLSDARRTLAGSFDHAVHTYGYDLPEYYSIFINSTYPPNLKKEIPLLYPECPA